MTKPTFAAVQAVIDDECDFRDQNPHCGRVTEVCIHYGIVVGADPGEVAFVSFERIGMNLIERGVQTIIAAEDGSVKRGRIRDYTSTYHDGVPVIPAGKSFPSFADAARLTPETAPR